MRVCGFEGLGVFGFSFGIHWDAWFGMLPLILTVLNRDYGSPLIIVPSKDCSYRGEHPKV